MADLLTTHEVATFVARGFLAFPAAIPDDLNAAAIHELDQVLATWGTPERPFAPSPAEVTALDLIRSLRAAGADRATIARRLDALYSRLTSFTEVAAGLLQDANLLLTADLEHPLSMGS